jgi:hypothetical protein
MRNLRKARLAPFVIIVGMVFSVIPNLATAQAESVIDEQFQVQGPGGPGFTGYLVNNTRSLVRFYSFLATFKVENQKIVGMKPCNGLDECPKEFSGQVADINLTLCNNATEENCIRGVRATNLQTKKVITNFVPRPELTEGFNAKIKGSPEVDLPNGGNPLIVSIPEAPHAAGDLYLIKSDYYAARKSPNDKFKLDLITNGIYPVTVESGKFNGGGPNLDSRAYVGKPGGGNGNGAPPYLNGFTTDARCLMATNNICIVPQAFPEKFSFGITLRANQGFTSWLYGRLANPVVTVSKAKVDEKAVLVNIDAEPVKVPLVYGWAQNSTLPPRMLSKYDQDRSGGIYFGDNPRAPLDTISILKGHSNKYDDLGIEEMLSWMPLLGDKAVAMPSQWSFQTLVLRSDTAAKLSKCTSTVASLSGLIFTNASVFSSGAPAFDAKEGTLDYKVAAPHLKPNGDLMAGTYDLVLNSTVARCLYGFTKAPIGARISIINADGTNQVATTIISEKDGFFRMGAYGFGFSSPTIKVKITQAKAAKTTKKG